MPVNDGPFQDRVAVIYHSVDGVRIRKWFKTMTGARKFAARMVGEHPEIGMTYAVSGDGVGKVMVRGASLDELFPAQPRAA